MKQWVFFALLITLPLSGIAEEPQLKSRSEFLTDSQQICNANWTKRGELDVRMYDYCMRNQMDGFEKLVELHQYASQNFYSEIAFPYCSEKWTKRGVSDASMMAYCLNQEVEGAKDVMYYRKTYGENKVNEIVGVALAQFKSWHMAAYKVKQNFEN